MSPRRRRPGVPVIPAIARYTRGTAMPELKKTLCNRDCPDVCSIVATVEAGRITRLQGDKAHPITQGFLCHRTSQFLRR